MAQFKFTLQTVLEQRQTQERLCQMELAQTQLDLKHVEEELAGTEREIASANDTMRDKHLVGKIDVTLIASHRRYLLAMRQRVIQIAERIVQARLAVEAKQRKLVEAAVQRKAIETLKDKQKSRWATEQDRKELAIADDVGMQIAYHNMQQNVGGSAA
jgi:flagellar protein FliJ